MRFSERMGHKPVREAFQTDSMDVPLRNGLWNVLWEYGLSELNVGGPFERGTFESDLCRQLWSDHYKERLDSIPPLKPHALAEIKKRYLQSQWYEVYDLVEFMDTLFKGEPRSSGFTKRCNAVLRQELSGYCLVGGRIVQVTDEEEIAEIENVLAAAADPVKEHLQSALAKLADRAQPDYRNSIKESISAVEAVCNKAAGTEGATLGTVLKKLELHPALRGAFEKLYGYTSDAEGIRHALMEKPNLDLADARFMLVVCSAFVNYVLSGIHEKGTD